MGVWVGEKYFSQKDLFCRVGAAVVKTKSVLFFMWVRSASLRWRTLTWWGPWYLSMSTRGRWL